MAFLRVSSVNFSSSLFRSAPLMPCHRHRHMSGAAKEFQGGTLCRELGRMQVEAVTLGAFCRLLMMVLHASDSSLAAMLGLVPDRQPDPSVLSDKM